MGVFSTILQLILYPEELAPQVAFQAYWSSPAAITQVIAISITSPCSFDSRKKRNALKTLCKLIRILHSAMACSIG